MWHTPPCPTCFVHPTAHVAVHHTFVPLFGVMLVIFVVWHSSLPLLINSQLIMYCSTRPTVAPRVLCIPQHMLLISTRLYPCLAWYLQQLLCATIICTCQVRQMSTIRAHAAWGPTCRHLPHLCTCSGCLGIVCVVCTRGEPCCLVFSRPLLGLCHC